MTRPTFGHLLVPLDLSSRNARAVRLAGDLARREGARVTLLHVVHRIEALPAGELGTFYARLRRKAEAALRTHARRLVRLGVACRVEVLLGTPATAIVEYAARRRVDLIVMGSHRINPRARPARWGTTSYRVGVLCRCPVLLIK
jgi:nucleotide-binding universal stress UspA family protein